MNNNTMDRKRKMKSSGGGAALPRAAPITRENRIMRSLSSSTMASALGGAASSVSAMDSDADRLLSQDSGIDESLALPLSLIKGLRRKSSSIGIGSSSSNGGGSGNNSDNSALVSLGNNSFGFNFDCEESMLNSGSSPNNSEPDGKDGGGSDSDNGQSTVEVTASSTNGGSSSAGAAAMQVDATPATVAGSSQGSQGAGGQSGQGGGGQHMPPVSKPSSSSLNSNRSGSGSGSSDSGSGDGDSGGDSGSGGGSSGSSGTTGNRSSGKSTVSSLTMSSNSNNERSLHFSNGNSNNSHEEAAAAAVAHLQSIANAYTPQKMVSNEAKKTQARSSARPSVQSKKSSSAGTKRKADADDDEEDNDSGGYNSDDEGGMAASRSAPLGEAITASLAAPDVAASSSSAGAAAAMVATKQAAVAQQQQQQQQAVSNLPMPLQAPAPPMAVPALPPQPSSRDATSTGDPVEFDADGSMEGSPSSGRPSTKKARKLLDESKREERNAREKERSFRISRQINELRNLLSSGGVIVPKGTKSSVLTEAANYIRMLQQHQYRSEIDRHQLVQQMQIIGSGALGPQAATAIRHVAAQNGVWSLGNFGGVPPRSAMTYYQQGPYGVPGSTSPDGQQQPQQTQPPPPPQQQKQDLQMVTKIDEYEYRYVFNSCSVGMAIASMGGAFIDCNTLFCQLSQYTKQEVCSMTIFNLTSRQDLQHAFDLISKMISPPPEGFNQNPAPCVLRGAMKHRNDLGLSIALIKGDDGIAKCFCVTLIKNPASPFDTSRPIPATADFLQQPGGVQLTQPLAEDAQKSQSSGSLSSPAYTTG